MKVLRVQNVYHTARNIERLRSFYDTALGLPLKFADGDRWVQFSVQESNFALCSPAEAPCADIGAVVVFEVDGLDEADARVADAGGRIINHRDMGSHGQVLTFADPEGNIAQLFCRDGKATR